MKAHAAKRQSALYAPLLSLQPDDPRQKPFKAKVRAAYTDFFPMFDAPFEFGRPWRHPTMKIAPPWWCSRTK